MFYDVGEMNTKIKKSLLNTPIAQIIEDECLHWFADGSDGKRLLTEFIKIQRFRSVSGGVTPLQVLKTPEILHEFSWKTISRIGYIVDYAKSKRRRVVREHGCSLLITMPNPDLIS